MRIVHMTSVHPWNDNRIFNKMCRSLASLGNDVHLVGVMANNQDRQIIDGVTLHAVNKPANRLERLLKTTPAVIAKARGIPADLYHFHDPEFLPYIGRFQSVIRNPVVYDVHEDYPAAILSKSWLPKWCRAFVSKTVDVLERRFAMNIDGVIVAWPRIIDRFKYHNQKILINNYPYRDELQKIENTPLKRELGCFTYVGGLSPLRGILEMIRAIGMSGGAYKLILGGNWSSEIYRQECQAEPGWSICEDRGYMNRKDMCDLFAHVQAGLIAFFPEPNHLYSMPNKIFEYMSAGLPVIASDLPAQRSIVEETGCGLVADAKSPDAIFEKMRWMCEHPDEVAAMGSAGRHAIEDKFNWENEIKILITFYKDVLAAKTNMKRSTCNNI